MARRHPFLVFYLLACLIPVAIVGLYLSCPEVYYWVHGGPFEYGALVKEASHRAGVEMSSSLTTQLPVIWQAPVLGVIEVYAAAPTLAALIVVPCLFGWRALRDWLSRFRPWRAGVGCREGLAWYLLAALVMAALCLAIRLLRCSLGAEIRGCFHFTPLAWSWTLLGSWFVGAFLDQGGLLEEPGWRGFAMPLLQSRLKTPLAAALVLGFWWAVWHIPRDLATGSIERLGWVGYLGGSLPLFTLESLALSVIIGYFWNRVGGSTLMAIMVHGLANDALGLKGSLNSAGQQLPQGWFAMSMTEVGLASVVALLIIAVGGTALGRRTEREPPEGEVYRTVPA